MAGKTEKITKIIIIIAVLIIISLSAFAFIQNKFSKVGKLPEAAKRNPDTKEAYLFALEHPEILEQIPCYCGCENIEHTNNRDCYLDEKGNFVEHGAMCNGCVGTTLDVKKMFNEGKSIEEMKAFIEEKYGKFQITTNKTE